MQSVRPPAEAFAEIEEITAWAAHRIRVVLLDKGWLFLLSGSRVQLRVDLCSPWYPAPAQSELARPIPMRRAGHRRPGLHPSRAGSPTHHLTQGGSMNGQDWPEIVTERRETIATRTAEGTECTLIALRRRDGQLGLYLHGGIRCSVMLPPPVHAKLVAALARLGS